MSDRVRNATLKVTLQGALLVGGYSPPLGFLDAATAREPWADSGRAGRPFLPASTVRGALREACTRLARSDPEFGAQACTIDSPCTPASRCLVCEIFGAPGTDRPGVAGRDEELPSSGDGRWAGLRISDGEPEREDITDAFVERTGVGIDRARRAASEGLLFQQEVLDAPGTVFHCRIEGRLSDPAWELLRRALPLVTGIGRGRSRGLGAVTVTLEEAHRPPRLGPSGLRIEEGAKPPVARVSVTLLEPLLLGGLPPTGSVRRSGEVLAGSTLRGALASALLEQGIDPRSDDFQRAFVQTETCLRFSDLRPGERSGELPIPVPRSFLRCKDADREDHRAKKGVELDSLVVSGLATLLVPQSDSWRTPVCAVCEKPLRGVKSGACHGGSEVRKRIVTRLARDVYTRSSMPGMLYASEQLLPGKWTFEGTVSARDPRDLALLQKLTDVPIRVGGGRSRGQGLVSVRVGPFQDLTKTIRRRRESFARTFGGALERMRSVLEDQQGRLGALVPVLARTDLDVVGGPKAVPDVLKQQIFGDAAARVTLLVANQGIGLRGGWDDGAGQRAPGPRPLRTVVAAGSVWLFGCPEDALPSDEQMAQLQSSGIGEGTWLGLGQIELFHDVFREGANER